MKRTATYLALSAFAGAAAVSAAAFADADDIRLLGETKVGIVQAIQAAEKHTGGTAYDASLDDDSFSSAYEVNVAKDGKSFDVRVDGQTGDVLGSREDRD